MKNNYGNPITLGVIALLAIAVFQAPKIIDAMRTSVVVPQPVNPQPGPQPIVNLAERVQQAIGENPDMALRYAALYSTAMGVVGDTSRTPKQIQDEIGRAKKILGLDGGDEFREVVHAELSTYGGSRSDRAKWADSLGRLSEACKGAAK